MEKIETKELIKFLENKAFAKSKITPGFVDNDHSKYLLIIAKLERLEQVDKNFLNTTRAYGISMPILIVLNMISAFLSLNKPEFFVFGTASIILLVVYINWLRILYKK